jgi:hypothetical protein
MIMSEMKPPSGLRAPGKRLWASVVEKYELTAAELATLEQACRTADELETLQKAVKALPNLVTEGSTGQEKGHPLLAETRAHRQLLERLVGALNLPDADVEAGLRPAQRHAQMAARARWRMREVS